MKEKQLDGKDVVQSLVEKIPEEILKRTMVRKKKVKFNDQTEVLFRSRYQMAHQGIDKVQQRVLYRFDWPGLRKVCERWVNACLACLQSERSKKKEVPIQVCRELGV